MARRKVTSQLKNSKTHVYIFFGLTTFFFGIIAAFMITKVFAQNADTNQIYACVNKTNGNMRMVTSSQTCKESEKLVKWSIQGPPGPEGPAGNSGGLNQYFGLPFFCTSCHLVNFADRFIDKDFSYAQIIKSEFSGSDLHGVKFKNAYLTSNRFNDTNMKGADLSEIKEIPGWGYPQNNSFLRADLSDANFSNSLLHEFNFTGANLQNANFSGATLRGTKFTDATNVSTANFDGATLDNVTCPDGTNSNSHNNTCEGHF